MDRRQASPSSSSDSSPVERQQPQLKVQTTSPYPDHRTSPVHVNERRSPRTSALSPSAPAPVLELSYQHYQHYHHQQHPLRMHSQPRLLPSVFIPSHHVIQSPIAQGTSTPRLPSISMLTAAAAMQPHMQRQTSSSSSSSSSGPRFSGATDSRRGPTRAFADGPVTPPMIHPDDLNNICRYRNKRCGYPRATKRNGDRHNLCEKHRAKANQNQRKLESKRRTQKKSPPRTAPEPPHQSQQAHHQLQRAQQSLFNINSNGVSTHESATQVTRRV